MIYDLLEVFKEEYNKRGENLILGSYTLKDGLYIKIDKDGKCGYFEAKTIKKEKIFTNLEGVEDYKAFEWFKERDYYSEWLNANKMFYDKKLHNINYLSLFVKMESFISSDPKKILQDDAIKYQYKYLCNYKKFIKPKEREVLETFKEQLQNRTRRKDIIKKYRWIRDNLNSIIELAKEKEIKNYIKIFFDEDIERYKEESKIYYAIKIFNDIKYSKKIDDSVFGLSDNNMGLNAKKPFLEHKNRKISTSFMILKEDAIFSKKFFDWLKTQQYINKNPLTDEFFINRDFKDKDVITDFDYIPLKIDKLKEPIDIKNYLYIREKGKVLIEDNRVEYLGHLEDIVDEVLYNKQLKNNYYGEVYKKLDNHFASLIYSTRDAMSGYFKKYDDRGFFVIIKKYATYLAIEHIKQNRLLLAGLSLNLKFSLLKTEGEEIMNIKNIQEVITKKLSDKEYRDLTNEEFFYLSGQVARYLINQSEAHEKKGDMLEPYLRANSSKKLKKVIESDYFKYKHSISLGFTKFNSAMSLIMAYEDDNKLSISTNMDSFLVGALSDNIFYMKREE